MNEAEILQETGLSIKRQRSAIRDLIDLGILKVVHRGIHGVRHFHVDTSQLVSSIKSKGYVVPKPLKPRLSGQKGLTNTTTTATPTQRSLQRRGTAFKGRGSKGLESIRKNVEQLKATGRYGRLDRNDDAEGNGD